jgi:hypothetical protein
MGADALWVIPIVILVLWAPAPREIASMANSTARYRSIKSKLCSVPTERPPCGGRRPHVARGVLPVSVINGRPLKHPGRAEQPVCMAATRSLNLIDNYKGTTSYAHYVGFGDSSRSVGRRIVRRHSLCADGRICHRVDLISRGPKSTGVYGGRRVGTIVAFSHVPHSIGQCIRSRGQTRRALPAQSRRDTGQQNTGPYGERNAPSHVCSP